MRSRWRLILGVAVSAVFVFLTLRGLRLDQFVTHLRSANYLWLIPSVGVYFLGVWARTWRWQYMLRHIKVIPMYPLFRVMCIGYMGNNIFPARAGELLRSYVLRQEQGVRISASIATVVIERLFDGLTMLLFVFVALPLVQIETDALADYRIYIFGFTALFLGALAVFLVVAARPAIARAVYTPLTRWLLPARLQDPVLEAAERFMFGLESLSSGRDVLMIFGTSILVWLFETAKYWFVMHAFPFDVSFFALMLMNGVVNLATTLPAAPGYIGTFDAPGIAVLVAAGVDKEIAAAYTVVLHVALWLPITLLGAYYLWRSHASVQQMRQEMAARDDDGAGGSDPSAQEARLDTERTETGP